MKIITLLVAFLMAIVVTSSAQTQGYYGYEFDATSPATRTVNLPWTESFSGTTVYSDWLSINQDGDEYPWYLWDPNTFGADVVYGYLGTTDPLLLSVSYDDYDGALTPNNWIVGPIIPTGADSLSWYVQSFDPDYVAEHYAVYAIPATADVASFVSNPSSANLLFEETMSTDGWQRRAVSLSAFASQSFRIAIRHYNCSDQYVLMIDEISVTGTSVGPDNPDEPGEETAVENATVETFKIVPNPAVDVVTLVGVNNEMVNVYDATGRLVFSQMVNSTLNVSSLESGVYVVKAGAKESRLVVK